MNIVKSTFDKLPVVPEVWVEGEYFREYPENVCGDLVERSSKYGGYDTVVRGGYADIERVIKTETTVNPFPYKLMEEPTPDASLANIREAIAKTQKAAQNPPPTDGYDLVSMDEMNQKWHPDVTADDMAVWAFYQKNKLFDPRIVTDDRNDWSRYYSNKPDLENWLKKGLIAYDGKEYVPSYLYYSGNIYEKQKEAERNKDRIIAQIGEDNFRQQLERLKKARPQILRLSDPDSERLFISPLDPFVHDFNISRLADGTIFENEYSIYRAFLVWIKRLPKADFINKSNEHNVRAHYLDSTSFPKDTPESVKIITKRNAQLDGIHLFQRFIAEMILLDDQKRIEHIWNSTFNNWQEIEFKKIPVGFQMNRWFKNGPIDPKEALWDGVKFLGANGSGVIAFDVGVGKTMTAILAMAQALYTGQCKRPLVVVPNPTYAKWIGETVGVYLNDKCIEQGIIPQYRYRINDYYNLGVEYAEFAKANPPEDYTITFITYQALEAIGFSKDVKQELGSALFEILNQGMSKRERAKLREQIQEMLGDALANAVVNMDEMGWDYIVIDEAHNMKKIFTKVKPRVDESEAGGRGRATYALDSGTPSGQGIKSFFLCQYILRRNSMRNVVLLTATPFTNSPLEIYSVLSLVAYQNLEKRGINTLVDFFDKFINETSQQVVSVSGKIESKKVIKSFHNKIVLQSIIFSYILFKTGEEAKVKRPTKMVIPYLKDENGIILKPGEKCESALPPTTDQAYWLQEIAEFAKGDDGTIQSMLPTQYFDKNGKVPGRVLIAIALAQNCTLSPYLLKIDKGGGNYTYLHSDERPTAEEFIDSSPKLTYVVECIRTVKLWHESRGEAVSGQVIYMNMATEYFPMIKSYLVEHIGYNRKEIEIISGGMNQDKKEKIKTDFLEGRVKIIIGSASIKEGIDLQTRSTVLYNCSLDWNPTDLIQLEGRIWRQGNIHNYVRIVIPMIENSLDVFIFQKLEEKTSRINDIWKRAGRSNVLNIEELNPEEMKNALLTNPTERAKADIENELEKLNFEKEVFDSYVKELNQAQFVVREFAEQQEAIEKIYVIAWNEIVKQKEFLTKELEDAKADELSATKQKAIADKLDSITRFMDQEITEKSKFAIIKRACRIRMQNNGGSDYLSIKWEKEVDEQIKRTYVVERVQKNILTPIGLTLLDDIKPLIEQYQNEADALAEKIKYTTTADHMKELVDDYRHQREVMDAESKPIIERVQEFAKYNYLLSCLKDRDKCNLESNMVAEASAETPVIALGTDKAKRIRLARARAAALQLLFTLIEAA